MVKLVSGKVTFIHRPLWPAIVAIGTAREPWQMEGLSKEAKALLKKTDRQGKIECIRRPGARARSSAVGPRHSVHTERGFHMKEVQNWKAWARSVKLGKVKLTPAEAKAQLEAVVARLNQQFGAKATLPWQ